MTRFRTPRRLLHATMALGLATRLLGATNGVGFTRIPESESGLAFTNRLPDAVAAANQIRLNGSGVALGDVDGDGLPDVFLAGLDGSGSLFRNLGGFRFTNVTATAFPGDSVRVVDATGAVFADVDGDADADLLLNAIGQGTRLFLNDGTGRFSPAADSGLRTKGGTTSMALADIDGDGDLDLYVAAYRTTTLRTTGLELLSLNGRKSVRPEDRDLVELAPDGRVLEHGEPDTLYLNDGHGRFTAMAWNDGTFLDEDGRPLAKSPFDWGLSAAFRDLDGDGDPDLYVCNDFHSPDRIWFNRGDGRFRAAERTRFRHTPTFSMSVAFPDVDRDGRPDILVADMLSRDPARRLMQLAGGDPYVDRPGVTEDRPQFDRNALQWNRGDGTYADIAPYAGIEATDWTWSIAAVDVDLDGFEDVLCTTGHLFDTQDLDAEARIQQAGPWPKEKVPLKLLRFPRMAQARQAWRNRGDRTFAEVGREWGFDEVGVAHGMAFADLDGDGDLDIVVNNLNAPASLHRNDAAGGRLHLRLRGPGPNTDAVGARVVVTQPGMPKQSAEAASGGRYLSGDAPGLTFAAKGPMRVEVTWRDGQVTTRSNVAPGRLGLVAPAARNPASDRPPVDPAARKPLLEPVPLPGPMDEASHRFDEYAREPLLPRRLSVEWPAVSLAVPASGTGTVAVVGSGAGGTPRAWEVLDSAVVRADPPAFLLPRVRPWSSLLRLHRATGIEVLVAGASSVEDASGSLPSVEILDPATGSPVAPGFPPVEGSVGPLCAADVDADGDLDLFVGVRCRPGRWPLSAPSRWFRNDAGRWIPEPAWDAGFEDAGRVVGAVATDLDGDGWTDLALATELGPVRAWRNDRGRRFEPMSAAASIGDHTGWWHGLDAVDVDGDGRMDLVASNDGLNTGYLSAREQGGAPTGHGPGIWYGDIDGDGRIDLLEGRWDPVRSTWVPERDLEALMNGLPLLPERFATYAAFNRSTVAEVAGTAFAGMRELRATWLSSTVFLQRDGRFEARALPPEAQFAPAFGIAAGDFDGDGQADLFLAQNFHGAHPKTPRMDAGLGLLLLGNGDGTFRPLSPAESGLRIPGEQRGAAAGDADGDGRTDLFVGVHHGTPRLYRGSAGTGPLRWIRLEAGPANPFGIGASLRRTSPSSIPSPRLEVHAGSGSGSQGTQDLGLAPAEAEGEVEVVWPGGVRERFRVPAGPGRLRLKRGEGR